MNNAQMLYVPTGRQLSPPEEIAQVEDALYERRMEAFAWMRRRGVRPLKDLETVPDSGDEANE